jgi:hypothetical protein
MLGWLVVLWNEYLFTKGIDYYWGLDVIYLFKSVLV